MEIATLIRVCRLWHKDYDASLDYAAYYGFYIVNGNDLNTFLAKQ